MMTGSAVSKDDTSSLRGIPCAATVDLGDQFIASDWEQPLSLHFGFDGEPAPCFYNVVEPQSWENQGDVLGKQVSTPPKLTDDPSGVGPCNGMFSKSKKRKSTSECSKTASCLPVNRIKLSQEVEVETKKGKASGSNAGRSIVKQARDDHIHIRAKRGHATSSHSLAERVRREKINQRMRFLQELVPGCSKLTGKAVMLDEIINYVQSLQRQVEFLSMKLAAMEPAEQTIDSNSAVPTDIPVTREEKFAAMLIGFAMSSGLPYQDIGPQEFVNMSMTQEMVISNSINSVQAAIHRQNHEVHRMMQMGFLPKIPLGNTEVQGIIKRQQTTSCGPEHVLE